MTPEFVFGWLAAAVAMLIGIPQIVRLVRTRDTSGLSLVLWQAILAINLGWFVHGVKIAAANMVVTNLVGAISTLVTLALIIRARQLAVWRVLVPVVLGAGVMIAVDAIFGSAAFGVVAVVPAVVANAAQSVELVRAPQITGVSPLFLAGQFLNQLLWSTWAFFAGDPGTMISAPVTAAIAGFNFLWWVLRRAGLRAFFVRQPTPDLVAAGSTPVSFDS